MPKCFILYRWMHLQDSTLLWYSWLLHMTLMQMSWSYHCRMRTKILKTNCRSWSPTTPFWNRKLIPCVKRTGVLTAIRLMSDELQNPNEGKCVPVTSSPMHDKEFPWVPENNAKSKQRTKRQPSKKAKLTATANPAEPHRPPIEQNRSSHHKLGNSECGSANSESFFFGLWWN